MEFAFKRAVLASHKQNQPAKQNKRKNAWRSPLGLISFFSGLLHMAASRGACIA